MYFYLLFVFCLFYCNEITCPFSLEDVVMLTMLYQDYVCRKTHKGSYAAILHWMMTADSSTHLMMFFLLFSLGWLHPICGWTRRGNWLPSWHAEAASQRSHLWPQMFLWGVCSLPIQNNGPWRLGWCKEGLGRFTRECYISNQNKSGSKREEEQPDAVCLRCHCCHISCLPASYLLSCHLRYQHGAPLLKSCQTLFPREI